MIIGSRATCSRGLRLAAHFVVFLGFAAGGLSAEQCDAFETFSGESSDKLAEIRKLGGSALGDVKMLDELWKFIEVTPAGALQPVRREIRAILKDVVDRRVIVMPPGSAGSHHFGKLVDFFLSSPDLAVQFGVESALAAEMGFIATHNQFAKTPRKVSLADAVIEGRSLGQARNVVAMASALPELVSALYVRAARNLASHDFDVCGRRAYWDFFAKLVKGGPYYKEDGLESSDPAIASLEQAFAKEPDTEVRAAASKLIARLKSLQRETAMARVLQLTSPNIQADRNSSNDSRPPLIRAISSRWLEASRLLLRQGSYVDVRAEDWTTPLHWAAASGFVEAVHLLLSSGARIDARSNEGLTPLMVAARTESGDVVKHLLAAGADASIRSYAGDNALDLLAKADSLGNLMSTLATSVGGAPVVRGVSRAREEQVRSELRRVLQAAMQSPPKTTN